MGHVNVVVAVAVAVAVAASGGGVADDVCALVGRVGQVGVCAVALAH